MATDGVRPEIQALRALAVTLVVLFHCWPSALPGGYIGVDVFFVISGFLITSLLLREIDRSGRVSLTRFWARRARRILPAALLTLLVCALATVLVVPIGLWPQFLAELRASTVYVQNWQLAADAGDYFAVAEDVRSPVQHFWSLSVEEQFYVLWPIVLAVAAGRRRTLVAAIAGLTALSLAYSVYETTGDPAAAYFVTPTRAWEFGAGGLLAAIGPARRPSVALCCAGLGAILAGAVRFSPATPFPGVAALVPVLGAAAVIHAGPAVRALAIRPVQFLGNHSYSIYLWHWPLLVLAPFVLARELDPGAKLTLLALTLVLAWLSKRLVEDPVRTSVRLTPWWTFSAAGAATLGVLAVVAGATASVHDQLRQARDASQTVLAAAPKCFGAAAHDRERPCRNPALRLSVVPTPLEAHALPNLPCPVVEHRGPLQVCTFGAPTGTAVALLGDSHASHWRAALDVAARASGWHGLSMTHTGCPLSTAAPALREPERSVCVDWRGRVFAWFERHPEVSTVFVSAISAQRKDFEAEVRGYLGAWERLPATIRSILVLRDTPRVRGNTDVCVERELARHHEAGPACAVPRSGAISRDAEAIAAGRLRTGRLRVVELTDFLCDTRRCEPVIGGALVYKDNNHLTTVFSRSLGPYLRLAIERAGTP
jgi:peptidoglycan/LPS O-acetylase OafA/YrhL